MLQFRYMLRLCMMQQQPRHLKVACDSTVLSPCSSAGACRSSWRTAQFCSLAGMLYRPSLETGQLIYATLYLMPYFHIHGHTLSAGALGCGLEKGIQPPLLEAVVLLPHLQNAPWIASQFHHLKAFINNCVQYASAPDALSKDKPRSTITLTGGARDSNANVRHTEKRARG